MKYTDLQIGKTIEHYRLKAGLTISFIAYTLNISQPTMSRIEKGSSPISLADFLTLCEKLNIKPNAFIKKMKTFNPQIIL